jgi:hypothetical protein
VKIFISYSRDDAGNFAKHIYRYLRDNGYGVFIDVNSIRIGEPWSHSIEKNISECDILIVILTPDSLRSDHVEREVLQAQKENKIIVPCIHEHVDYYKIKWGLNEKQGIEFSDKYELVLNLYPKIKNYGNNFSYDDENKYENQNKELRKEIMLMKLNQCIMQELVPDARGKENITGVYITAKEQYDYFMKTWAHRKSIKKEDIKLLKEMLDNNEINDYEEESYESIQIDEKYHDRYNDYVKLGKIDFDVYKVTSYWFDENDNLILEVKGRSDKIILPPLK